MRNLKQLLLSKSSIAGKVFLGYSILLIFASIATAYSLVSLNNIDRTNEERNRITQAQRTALDLDVEVLRIIVDLQYYVETKDPQLLASLNASRAHADQLRAELRQTTQLPEVARLLDQYEALLPERRQLAEQIFAALQTNVAAPQLQQLRTERRIKDDQAREYLKEIIALEESAASTSLVSTTETIRSTQRNLLFLNVPLLLLIIIFGILLARSITRPLRALDVMTRRIGQGDFSPTTVREGHDEINRLEQSLNKMTQDLAQLDKSKSEFISLVSHQLRTPATAVKQALGLIIEGYVPDRKKESELMQSAYDSNEEQLAIIDDILNVAKIDAGKLEIRREACDVRELAKNAVSQLEGSAKQKHQTLTLQTDEKPVTASVDKLKVSMCIENLISNAIKYTPEHGNISVAITQKQRTAVITVSDDGIGMSKTEQTKLFTKFGRIENDYTIKVQGTGLGLYLVKQFVRLHGGTIEVRSATGKGTTFIITLPKE